MTDTTREPRTARGQTVWRGFPRLREDILAIEDEAWKQGIEATQRKRAAPPPAEAVEALDRMVPILSDDAGPIPVRIPVRPRTPQGFR